MELAEYLGNELVNDIKTEAVKKSQNFLKTTPATKLQLADEIKIDLEIKNQAICHLITALDNAGQNIEEKEKIIEEYKRKFGEIDLEFIKQNRAIILSKPKLSHAKKLLSKYVNDYNNKNKDNKSSNN